MRSLFLALALLAAPAAHACSVAPGYRVPTTLELVAQSDAIIVAQPFDQRTGADGDPEILFASLAILKGAPGWEHGRDRISVYAPGVLAPETAAARPSDPRELVRAHPEAYGGGCTRYTFHPKQRVLLFLKREGDDYRVISYPFARTAEDTALPDSRWLKAVREYIAIAALPLAVRRARMEVRRDLLKARGDADSRAIAADIARELAGPRKPLREPLPPIK
ncbi:hypothetical protein [Sphingomonas sp.]|jgi:hypothetical protein|uniref:hypothetical protein n=1 Tax=Sphingomonas sp. TaxID=28214 RepID=UPI002E13B369|nr:hypothetical protein [Sphingomonas sp.]